MAEEYTGDFSSDVDTSMTDTKVSSEVSDFGGDDTSCDSLDDISDNGADFQAENDEYDTLDNIPDMDSDETNYDNLDDISDNFAKSNFESTPNESYENFHETDLIPEASIDTETDSAGNIIDEYSDNENKVLDDIPDESASVEEDGNKEIETLDDIDAEELSVENEEAEKYKTLEDIPDSENETFADDLENSDVITDDDVEILTTNDISDEESNKIEGEQTINSSERQGLHDEVSETTTDEATTNESDLTEPEHELPEETNDLDSAVNEIMDSNLSAEHKKELLEDLKTEISQESGTAELDMDDDENHSEPYQKLEEQDTDNASNEDSPKVLKRELTDEQLSARNRDTEETLDNYRENLRNYGVDEESMEDFINQERDKINSEYESLDNGDTSSNIYHMPTDWENVADGLKKLENATDSMSGVGADIDDVMKSVVDDNVSGLVLPKNGEWSDKTKIGNSDFIISDDAEIKWRKDGEHFCNGKELKEWMKERYGVSSVSYRNKEPDFSPFEDENIGEIKVDKLATDRNGSNGSFSQAIAIAAERMNMSESELKKYMSENQLTWHECSDRHTICAIPTRINSAFKHSGGISMQKSVEAMGTALNNRYGRLAVNSNSVSGTVDATKLLKALENQRALYRQTKKDLFGKKGR